MTAGDQTKVVVRGLPPSLTEASFKAELDNEGFTSRCNWFSFSNGKHSVRTTRTSTAYINFNSAADVLAFSHCFDGRKFISDGGGGQTTCSVEYAPFQRIIKGRVKRDPREGTIEQDAAYQAFIQELEQKPEMLPSAEQQLEELEAGAADSQPAPIVTPLMLFMQEKLAPKQRKVLAVPKSRAASGSGLRSDAEAPRSNKGREGSRTGNVGATGSRLGGPDNGQAARDAARRALGLPPSGSRQSEASEPVRVKVREQPVREPKVRPGFGTWQPRRSAGDQADPGKDSAAASTAAAPGRADNSRSGAATPAASRSGKVAADPGSAADASVAAAERAATAALRSRAADLVSASRSSQASKGRKSGKELGLKAGAAEQPAAHQSGPKPSRQAAGSQKDGRDSVAASGRSQGQEGSDAAPAPSKSKRKQKGRGGSGVGAAAVSEPAAPQAPAAQPQPQRSASGDGSQQSEGSTQTAAARKSRQRNRQKKPAPET